MVLNIILYGKDFKTICLLKCKAFQGMKKKSVDKRMDIFNKMCCLFKKLPHFSSQISDESVFGPDVVYL